MAALSIIHAVLFYAAIQGQPGAEKPAADAPAAKSPGAQSPAATNPAHPIITEILYAVPSGSRGDADQDGTRDAVGDEFIEIVNPGDKPINLKGYVLADALKFPPPDAGKGSGGQSGKSQSGKDRPRDGATRSGESNQLRFTFPDFTLGPGEVAVVFNGYRQSTPGPVGDEKHAPAKKNDKFGGAWVFSTKNTSQYAAFGNQGDSIALSDPAGKVIQCVAWGNSDGKASPQSGGMKIEKAPESTGSVQRSSLSGDFAPHATLSGEVGAKLYSPGVFELPKK